MRENQVIANQKKILANQEQIKQNQDKLDLLLVSQETILANQEQIRQLEAQLSQLLQDQDRLIDEPEPIGEMIGSSPAFKQVLKEALSVADADITVLLRGETGTGKELLAHAIHAHSPRRRRPFVIVNCAALPAPLIESELFGYEKGAFTGALGRRAGRFESANGGTIFLDEIGEVPLEIQARFLRVLQNGVFERLGGNQSIRVKVRILAATNQHLEHLVTQGRFRADLYYRLNGFPITLPPLRDRPSDIPLLIQHYAGKFSSRFKRPIRSISEHSLQALQKYTWPGNIRELEHLVERAVLTSDGEVLIISLPDSSPEPAIPLKPEHNGLGPAALPSEPDAHLLTLAENERWHIEKVLQHTHRRISGPRGAAAILGLPASTLRSRMKKLGIKITESE